MQRLKTWTHLSAPYVQVLVLSCYCYFARAHMGLSPTTVPVWILVSYSILLDLLIGALFFSKIKRVPVGAAIIALALSILIESTHAWVYIVAISLAHFSKSFLTTSGRHHYNPANFGAIAVLLLLPQYSTSVSQMFSIDSTWYYIFLSIGLIVSAMAGQITVSVVWAISFAALATLKYFFVGGSILVHLAAVLSPTWLLFTFHMITDPKTTPRSTSGKIYYSVFIAVLDLIPRLFFIPNSTFFALFLYSSLRYCQKLMQRSDQLSAYPARVLLSTAFLIIGSTITFAYGGLKYPSEKLFFWDPVPVTYPTHPKSKFEEQGSQRGLDFVHQRPKANPIVQNHLEFMYTAPGVSVADFNNDGWLDIFVANGQPSYGHGLFINNGSGQFESKSQQWFSANQDNVGLLATSGTLIDANRDGYIDLFIVGYGCPQFYLNKQGVSFENQTEQYIGRECDHMGSSIPFDYNSDGFMDLYVLGEVPSKVDLIEGKNIIDWTPDNPIDSHSGKRNRILLNQNGQRFTTVYDSEDNSTRWSIDAGFSDIDGDGELDLVVANDWGRDEFFHVTKSGFKRWSPKKVHYDRGNGMNVSFYWPSVKSEPITYISNIWIAVHKQIGNYAWTFDPVRKQLIDRSYSQGIHQCGWAWASLFFDHNNNGLQDLYVANGMISKQTPKSIFNGEYKNEFLMSVLMASRPVTLETMQRIPADKKVQIPKPKRRLSFLDMDSTVSIAGFQRDCFFINQDSMTFSEESARVGFHDFADARGVIAADFSNSGRLDLVVTAQNQKLRYYKNQTRERGNFVSIELRDRFGNELISGGEVTVKGANTHQKMMTEGGKKAFFSYNGRRIHFGLNRDQVIEIKVVWPSGSHQVFTRVEANHHYRVIENRDNLERLW